jgi:hypothetical protein
VSPIEIWVKRILEFKYNCSNKILNRFQNEISASLEMSIHPQATQNKIISIQDKALADEKLITTVREKALENQFEEFKRQTKDLLEKEDIYETKLEQEEKERIEWEQKKMRESVKNEQMMSNKIINDVQTIAYNDNSYAMKERAIKREMKNIMNDLQTKISLRREKLINKLQRMKTLNELSEKRSVKELIDMKREMGKKLSILAKKGNPNQCLSKNPAIIENYCSVNFKDFDMQIECKKINQFCYMCCDSEIGPLNRDYLNCCYNKCDEVANNGCITFNETYHITQQQMAFLN